MFGLTTSEDDVGVQTDDDEDRGLTLEGVWRCVGDAAGRSAAAGGGYLRHGEAGRWAEAEEWACWAGSAVSVQRTVDSGGRTAWLNQQLGL